LITTESDIAVYPEDLERAISFTFDTVVAKLLQDLSEVAPGWSRPFLRSSLSNSQRSFPNLSTIADNLGHALESLRLASESWFELLIWHRNSVVWLILTLQPFSIIVLLQIRQKLHCVGMYPAWNIFYTSISSGLRFLNEHLLARSQASLYTLSP